MATGWLDILKGFIGAAAPAPTEPSPEEQQVPLALRPSTIGAPTTEEPLTELLAEEEQRRFEFEQLNPTRTHKFMEALGALSGFVDPSTTGVVSPTLMAPFLPGASTVARQAIRKEVVSPMTRLFRRGSPVRKAAARGLRRGVVYTEPAEVTIKGAGGVEGPSYLRGDVDIVAPSPVKAAERRVEVLQQLVDDPEFAAQIRRHEFSHVGYHNLPKGAQEIIATATVSGELPLHQMIRDNPRFYGPGRITKERLANENYAFWMDDYMKGRMELVAKTGGMESKAALKFFKDKLGATQGLVKHTTPARTYERTLGAFVGDPDLRTMWPTP